MQHSDEFNKLCDEAKKHIKEVSIDEAEMLMKNNEIQHLIDVRDHEEFIQGAIPSAIHLSKGWIEAKIHNHVDNKEDKILLYCGGGNRSALAAENLQKMGYTNVYSMIGGYKAWINADKD